MLPQVTTDISSSFWYLYPKKKNGVRDCRQLSFILKDETGRRIFHSAWLDDDENLDQRLVLLSSRRMYWAQTALSPRTRLCLDTAVSLFFCCYLGIIFIWCFSIPTRCIEMGKLHSKHGKVSSFSVRNYICSYPECALGLWYFRVTLHCILSFSQAAICKPRESPEGKRNISPLFLQLRYSLV